MSLSRKHLCTELGASEMKGIKLSMAKGLKDLEDKPDNRKRITFKDLDRRNLGQLFAYGTERIKPPLFGQLNRLVF